MTTEGEPDLETERSATSKGVIVASAKARSVAAIWQKMFELPQVSIDENFFDLGGHSLLVVRMHKRLEEQVRR